MIITISPTKTMKYKPSSDPLTQPLYEQEAKTVLKQVKACGEEEFKKHMGSQYQKAYELYNKEHPVGSALSYYDGLQFKYMELDTLDEEALAYLHEHVRIMSGMYGMLRASDGIVPYRLELQTKMKVEDELLQNYWKKKLQFKDELVINLCSKEYSTVLPKNVITIHFRQRVNQQLVNKATIAKMNRGKMIKAMAMHQVQTLEALKQLEIDGYGYDETHSDEHNLYFIGE